MIHVDRIPAPAPLAGEDSPAAGERRRAEAFYADPTNDGKSFKFSVYRRREVKRQLERMFHGKCAYCESKYLHNQPGDVEHFRPKGGYVVDGQLCKPGYWWLAASWSNLLPSCIDCNRKRTQEFVGEVEHGSGKENLFPILDEARRARTRGAEEHETRLLLDPCRDRPEELLELGEDGVIRPRSGLGPLDRRRAEESIDTYGLHRTRLNEARRDHNLSILGHYGLVLELLGRLRDHPRDESVRRKLATSLKTFRRFRRSGQQFALMARQLIDPTLARIRPFLDARLGADLPATPNTPGDILERFVAAYAEDDTRHGREAELDDILGSFRRSGRSRNTSAVRRSGKS